jgi:8-oxo-dGTP diphosphatase
VTVNVPRVGVGIVVRRERELLLVRRAGTHGSGTWSTPGGHLDYGEDPAACAGREAEEETGVSIGPARFAGVTNDVFEAEGKHYVTLWFEAEHASGDATALAEDELDAVGWFDEDALPEPLFPPLVKLLSGRTIE